MGKGDKKSYRGKLILGSFGKTRPRKRKKTILTPAVKTKDDAEAVVKPARKKAEPAPEVVVETPLVTEALESQAEPKPKKAAAKTTAKAKPAAKKAPKEPPAAE